ncbi:MAG: hypothetical protein Q8P67_13360 [archaeon]|nr:hypothetical protein [archaeon]
MWRSMERVRLLSGAESSARRHHGAPASLLLLHVLLLLWPLPLAQPDVRLGSSGRHIRLLSVAPFKP